MFSQLKSSLLQTNNTWFIDWPRKEKKRLPFLFINAFRDLQTVYFKPEVTTGRYVRARAALADKRIPVFPGLSCLLANASKDDVMSYLTCSKTISGLLYEFNRSILQGYLQLNYYSRNKDGQQLLDMLVKRVVFIVWEDVTCREIIM